VGYRLDRAGELANWWVRAVDPDELDLAPLGQPPVTDDHPPVAVVSSSSSAVALDVNGIRLSFTVRRIGAVSYVDSPEGSVALTELPRFPEPETELAEGTLVAPLPGQVSRVVVVAGQRVRAGELLMTLEAMKLEHPVHAPAAGVVTSLPVSAGAQVDTGTILAVLTPEQ
jgi:propionyl-CoA carboxylase alpha chain